MTLIKVTGSEGNKIFYLNPSRISSLWVSNGTTVIWCDLEQFDVLETPEEILIMMKEINA